MTDMRVNPGARGPMNDPVTMDKLQSQKAMKAVNDEVVGFKPLDQRKAGKAKLVAYHITNAIFLGAVGAIGAYAANSKVMGSQKTDGWSKAWRDFGQTHLNATLGATGRKAQRSNGEKFMNFMAKAWSHVPSLLTGGLAALPRVTGHALQKARKTEVFNRAYQKEFGADPLSALTNNLGSGKVVDKATGGFKDRVVRQVAKEVAKITDNFERSLQSREAMRGSPELRALFSQHMNKEMMPETMMGIDWAEKMAANVPPDHDDRDAEQKLSNPKADYQLNKLDVVRGYVKLVKADAPFQMNLSYRDRKNFVSRAEADDSGLREFSTRWNAEIDSLASLQDQLKHATGFRNRGRRKQLKTQIQSSKAHLTEMQNEKLDVETSKTFGTMIGRAWFENHDLIADSASRFTQNLKESLG